jgi:hypothetical protein
MNPFPSLMDALPFVDMLPPLAILALLVALALWSTVIKAFALWHAARNGQTFWFVALLVLNSLGILELVYLLAFRKDKQTFAPSNVASGAPAA